MRAGVQTKPKYVLLASSGREQGEKRGMTGAALWPLRRRAHAFALRRKPSNSALQFQSLDVQCCGFVLGSPSCFGRVNLAHVQPRSVRARALNWLAEPLIQVVFVRASRKEMYCLEVTKHHDSSLPHNVP